MDDPFITFIPQKNQTKNQTTKNQKNQTKEIGSSYCYETTALFIFQWLLRLILPEFILNLSDPLADHAAPDSE
jgi:hypothetical protein